MKDYSIKSFFRILMLLTCVVSLTLPPLQAYSAEPVRIGVLAFRPKPQTLEQWQPLAIALKKALPEHDFEVQALNFSELEKSAADNQLDFVLTNPAHYILLTKRSGLSAPLATLATNENGQRATMFGGVIFTRLERSDIQNLTDIKNKSIATTDVDSFGGFMMQTYELSKVGINARQDNKLVITGMPHDNVVGAVLNGRAEVGFVRTGVLESMVREGNLEIEKIKIINRQKVGNFPVQSSTRLYPEWVFAYMPSVDENLARHVAAALFGMEENSSATRAMNIHGFVVPADYATVADVLKELRVKPFDIAPSFTLRDVWIQYKYGLIGALVAFCFIGLLGIRLVLTKRKLDSEHQITLTQQKRLHESETHLSAIIRNEPECIKIVDAHGQLIEMNPAGLAMLEADSLAQLAGKPVLNVIAPEYRTAFTGLHKRVIAGASEQMEFEVIGLKGGRRWLETHAVPLEENGGIVHLAVTRDITEKKRTEAILIENEERLALATLINGVGVWDWNLQTMQLVWDDSMFALYNLKREDFSGAFDAWEKTLHPDDLERATQKVQDTIAGKKSYDAEFRIIWLNGDVHHIKAVAKVFYDKNGKPLRMLGTNVDVTERKKMEEEVRQLAYFDTLTKLPNRRLLNDRLSQTISACKRNKTYTALMFLDLDNFKSLNDTHGHEAGDMLLIEAANRLTSCIREMDTVARFGGDEFVVMLSELSADKATSTLQATIVAEKIRVVLSEQYTLTIRHNNQSNLAIKHRCTATIGVIVFNGSEGSQDDIMKWADVAMYEAKDAGRNLVRFYSDKS